MSLYYEIAGHVSAIIKSSSAGDEYETSARTRALKDTVKRMDDNQPYSPFHLSLIFADLLKLPLETDADIQVQFNVVKCIRNAYGENHIVMGDLCKIYYYICILCTDEA